MKTFEQIKEQILSGCYIAVTPGEVKTVGGAQIIDNIWYIPKWGCDTLNHIMDILEEERNK